MGIVGVDPTGLVPESTKRRLFDSLIDFLESQTEKAGHHKAAEVLRDLRSDADFRDAFDQALQRAVRRFVDQYAAIDREMLVALMHERAVV